MDKITIERDFWNTWEVVIPPERAPSPEYAYEGWSPGVDVEQLNLIGMYGPTYWETYEEALSALARWEQGEC